MAKGFASLSDKLGDKKVACRVRGCPRTWIWRGAEQVKAFSAGQTTPPARMCDLCHARAQSLEDVTVPCQTAGCEGSFPWSKYAQLEAIIAHAGPDAPAPPRGLCDACRAKAKEIGSKDVPCRVKGCAKTWVWSGRAQLAAGASDGAEHAPPSRMCDSCHELYERLHDARRPCKVKGCANTWGWTRWQQLEAQVQGRGGEPPERMCDDCVHFLKGLEDRELPCRTDGCDGKWLWTRGQQLEAHLTRASDASKDVSGPPQRMCSSCQSKFSHLKDITVGCKRTGCKSSWTFKRGTQLERWVKHGEGPDTPPPQRLCETCRKRLDDFQDREVPCKNAGCKDTWTWTRFAQLQAAEGGHGNTPPAHMCNGCREFLQACHTKTITCAGCGAHISWAPELQLKTKLGLMREPTLCGSCKQKEAAATSHRPRTSLG